jgi:WD40 repeat protein
MMDSMKFKKILQILLILSFVAVQVSCSHDKNPLTNRKEAPLINATLSNNGNYLLVVQKDTPAQLWDVKKNIQLYNWLNSDNPLNAVTLATLSLDENYGLTASKEGLALWDIKTGRPLSYWMVHDNITAVDTSKDGVYALVGYGNGNADYIDLLQGQAVRRFHHESKINSTALSQDNRFGITGSEDKTAILWNIQTGKNIRRWSQPNGINLVAISPNSEFALTATRNGDILIWRLRTGQLLYKLNQNPATATAVRFSHNNKYLALATLSGKIELWDMDTGKLIQTWQNKNKVLALAFSEDDKQLLTEDSVGLGTTKAIIVSTK